MLVELQGELSWEGDRAGGVVGVLGLDRPVSYYKIFRHPVSFTRPR